VNEDASIHEYQVNPQAVRRALADHFNDAELRELCFALAVDYEKDLEAGNTAVKERSLVAFMERQNRLAPLAEEILKRRPHIPPTTLIRDSAGDSPFKGLRYFEEADEHLFFGRESLTDTLLNHLLPPSPSQGGDRGESFLAVVGASGSGKSSVVRAGLVPALRRRVDWPIHVFTPTADPLTALAEPLTRNVESVTAFETLIDDLESSSRALELFVARRLKQKDLSGFLLVIDQFEELFTLCKQEEKRRAFVDNIVNAVQADNGLRIILTLRADFYHRCLAYESLHVLLEEQQKIVPAMDADELRAAIEQPAARAGLVFEDGLVELLLRDVGATDGGRPEPGALPLLSHALLETWRRRRGNRLTLAGYQAAGGVQGAIAQTAESVYQSLDEAQQQIARNIFLHLTELGEGAQDTRRRAALEELLPQNESRPTVEKVLKTLADARLVTTGDEGAEVAHEALIREWPTLQAWLDENREGLRLHRRLTEAAQIWEVNGRDASYLYRGGRLQQAEEWAQSDAISLNKLEREFLQAGRRLRRDELADARARAEREADAAQKLRQRALFLRGTLVLAAALALVALFLFGNANDNANLAATRAAEAEAAQIEAEAKQQEVEQQRQVALAQSLAALSDTVLEQNNEVHWDLAG
jgi:hypothetical protein